MSLSFCAQITGIKLWKNRAYSAPPQSRRGRQKKDHFLIDIK